MRRARRGKILVQSNFEVTTTPFIYSVESSQKFADSTGASESVTNSHVGHIKDKGLVKPAAIQNSVAFKPILRQQSGKSVLEFDGVDDHLTIANGLISNTGNYTIVVSFKSANVVGTATPFAIYGTNSAILFQLVDGVPRVILKDDSSVTYTLNSGLQTQAWNPTTMTLIKNGNLKILRVNGVQVATNSDIFTATYTNASIGANAKDLTGFMEGILSEVWIDDAFHSGRTLQQLESYSRRKNNIPSDPVTLSVSNITVDENVGSTSLAISLNRTSALPVTVDYTTQNGTATQPGDYTTAAGSLSYAVGETIKTVPVTIINDTDLEPAETINFVLSNASNATIGNSGQITIRSSDSLPSLVQYYGGYLWDFNDLTTLFSDDGVNGAVVDSPIYRINSTTDSNKRFYQSTSTQRPILKLDSTLNRYYGEFGTTGGNRKMFLGGGLIVANNHDDFTYIACISHVIGGTGFGSMIQSSSGSSNLSKLGRTSNKARLSVQNQTNFADAGTFINNTTPMVHSATFQGISGASLICRTDYGSTSTTSGEIAVTSGAAATTAYTECCLGGSASGSDYLPDGTRFYGAVILPIGLSAAQLADIAYKAKIYFGVGT